MFVASTSSGEENRIPLQSTGVVRIEPQCPLEFILARIPMKAIALELAKRGVRLGEFRIEAHGRSRSLFCTRSCLLSRQIAVLGTDVVRIRQAGVGEREL